MLGGEWEEVSTFFLQFGFTVHYILNTDYEQYTENYFTLQSTKYYLIFVDFLFTKDFLKTFFYI